MDPSRYIEKVSLLTGEVLPEAIDPAELLVHRHRDYHVLDMQARRILGRMAAASGDPSRARARMRRARRLGHQTAEILARLTPKADPAAIAEALFGLARREHYFRYRTNAPPREEAANLVRELREGARERLSRAVDGAEEGPGIRVLLTGGTGFLGKEILWQAARDADIAEILVLVRPKKGLDAETRGEALLGELGLTDDRFRDKIRFVPGDVTRDQLGIPPETLGELATRVTHLVHCAASVAFDDPYEKSFEANVDGTLNALRLSRHLHRRPGSSFVAHVAIETAYIHGRRYRLPAREDELVFPRNFYNNYYELTKAMASLETQRFMFQEKLPIVQLCPAIVIGHEATGNNRGDTKVVNAPVNLFGQAHEALRDHQGGLMQRTQAGLLAWIATIFPADPSAPLNLIPVDWVARGVLASLQRAEVVGERIHLATDKPITSRRMVEIVREELGTRVKLAEPTLHRNVLLPLLTRVLHQVGQKRVATGLERLANVFGGYGEWSQPIHEVSRDVTLLGLPASRPDTEKAFRMLCRHNRWVQEFGRVRDPLELARRERVWEELLDALRRRTARDPAELPAAELRAAIRLGLDLEAFEIDAEGLGSWQPERERRRIERLRQARARAAAQRKGLLALLGLLGVAVGIAVWLSRRKA
jgi:nucleoside-diphosphate-sugar epimerase